jgi:hypothetical protein
MVGEGHGDGGRVLDAWTPSSGWLVLVASKLLCARTHSGQPCFHLAEKAAYCIEFCSLLRIEKRSFPVFKKLMTTCDNYFLTDGESLRFHEILLEAES